MRRKLSIPETILRAKEILGAHHEDCEWKICNSLDILGKKRRARERMALSQNKKKIFAFESALRKLKTTISGLPDEVLRDQAGRHCQDLLLICSHIRKYHVPGSRNKALLKGAPARAAAEQALKLLRYYEATDVDASKDGRYCRLAALLYLDPQADLRRYCREELKTG